MKARSKIMESQAQTERETCRAIVLSPDGTEVLLRTTATGFMFPHVEIPLWERVAENLTAALKRDWGCDTVCLFNPNHSLQHDTPNGSHCEVMECWRDQRSGDADWELICSLTANSFQKEEDFRTLERSLYRLDDYEHDPSSPFARRGWLARLRHWAADVIRPLGLELTGSLHQYNASPAFNLIRLETTGPAVWFKAVGEPNLREFPITLKLAELFPRFVPEILGTKPEWNGWLSSEVKGTNLGETRDLGLWEKAAADLARLQIESISGFDSILDSGAHDLRTDALLSSLDPFFELVARLMEEQPKVPPPTLSRHELSLLKLRIEDSLTLLEDLQIPNTLGHMDLNAGNVIVSADRSVFLDWAEAYVGPPFFSLEFLLQHFRRAQGTNATLESQFVNAYKAPWCQLLSEDRISEALAAAPLTAVFAYAAGTGAWRDEEKLRDPKIAGYFRSLARRMNREAIQFIERRSVCLS
jgi:hypothetical protein